SGPTWLFDIDTLTKPMNYQPIIAGNQPNPSAGIQEHFDADKAGEGNVQQYVLFPLWSFGSKDPQNTDDDVTFKVKKPESDVHVSPSSSATTKKHDDKTKRKAKGKSPVELSIGVRNLRNRPTWLFDIDTLTQSMNYQPVVAGNQPNHNVGIQENLDASKVGKKTESAQQYMLLPLCSDKTKKHNDKTKEEAKGKSPVDFSTGVRNLSDEFTDFSSNSTNRVNAASALITVVGPNSTNSTNSFNAASPADNVVSPTFEIGGKYSFVDPSQYLDDPDMPALEDIVYSDNEEDVGAKADFSNLKTSITVSPIPTTRVHKDHPITQIISDLTLAPQTRSMARMGHTQEEGIDYEEVFAPVARTEAIRKSASTPIDTEKPLLKDPDGEDVDVHIDMLMIGSLMYLNSSRPYIMFAIYACARFHVTLKVSHLHAVKRIFSDYAGASLDRKSIIR
nr:hypothetical protein [Tanacetum cinerariifolium]